MAYNTRGFNPFFNPDGKISARYLPPMQGGDTATWETLEGRPEVVSAGSTKAEARSSIDAASIAQGLLADSAIQASGLTKEAVGLGNVDNTSDEDKPVSLLQAAAIAAATPADYVGSNTIERMEQITAEAYDDPGFTPTPGTVYYVARPVV